MVKETTPPQTAKHEFAAKAGYAFAAGACFGTAISVLPLIEVVEPSLIIWIPALAILIVWLFRRQGAYRALTLLSFAVLGIALVVTAAIYAPFKFEDQNVGPFKSRMSFAELTKLLHSQGVGIRINGLIDNQPPEISSQKIMIDLPQKPVTIHELIKIIERQTNLRHTIGYCGNGATILKGGIYPMGGIRFEPARR